MEDEASEVMSIVCETYCDELIQCLRQERFGGGFAAAMRGDPSQFGGGFDQAGLDQMISAMLPHFDAQNFEGSHARHALVADLGRVLASLQWGLMKSPDDCAEQDAHAQASLVIASMLDFLPKPTHQEILSVVERCLVKAHIQGSDAVFADQEIEDEEEPALAKSI